MFYSLFSHSWSGLLVAALAGGIGWLIVLAARKLKPRWKPFGWGRFLGYAVYGLAGLIVIGSFVAIFRIGTLESKYPPPGKLVDVGGYRMHIIAEGEARGQPTVVWVSGAHGQGLLMNHLHKAARTTGRSILFDRPGTGWSDTGPFPRRTAREAEELSTLLEKSGEKGPFVIVGHSYGGLLAANFARRYPSKVAALVLLDATPPDQMYGSFTGVDGIAGQVLTHQGLGLSKMVGFQLDIYAEAAKHYPHIAAVMAHINREIGDVMPQIRANEAGPASEMAAASLYGELSPANLRRSAMDLVVYDGELGAMPVYVAVPQGDFDEIARMIDVDEPTRRRMLAFIAHSRLRYLRTSTRSTLVYAPPGSSHNFPYEHPRFVLDLVRQAQALPR